MTLPCNLRRLALSFAIVVVAACRTPAPRDDRATTTSSVTASTETFESSNDDSSRHPRCPVGIQACPAAQSGLPCNPNNLSFLCSPQSNGAFCCLPNLAQ